MNLPAWLQSLITFRKSGGGGLTVPELSATGRIRVDVTGASVVVGTGLVVVAASPPATIDGSVLWMDSATYVLYGYDVTRAKWLSIDEKSVAGGRNGATAAGVFYRGEDSIVLDAINRGLPVQKGTVVYVGITRTDTSASTLQVLVNGVVISELAHSAAGLTSSDTFNDDFPSGLMSFRNKSTGTTTNNVQIMVNYRRRS